MSVIWFISLGKITDTFRISQAQSTGTKSKSFVPPPNLGCQMDVQRGVPPPALELTHFHSPWNSLFISPPPVPHVIHPFLCFLIAAVWYLSFWCPAHLDVCNLDLFFFVTLISPLFQISWVCFKKSFLLLGVWDVLASLLGFLWLGNRKGKLL